MSITKTFEDELEKFFEYKLAPYPLSLFDAMGMRKTMKSAFYNCFEYVNIEIDNTNAIYIIDGGYLLHRVVWDRDETFHIIFEKYVQYVQRHILVITVRLYLMVILIIRKILKLQNNVVGLQKHLHLLISFLIDL
ncbi:hypothetical protein ALC57_04450 [Trachymyrmex cornetzi]|uniref:Uncharacterized protein n=1 Tax=Trachymyrmex cornetzi TaxID=471704 RepID=A0A151JCH1_9HYME|nr:hypothetical protein ALC57_04450 [Trachymyrmex cornetzi]